MYWSARSPDEEASSSGRWNGEVAVAVPDAIFADPRLADIYDDVDADRRDLVHYVAMVEELAARSVLDVGCGTGTFASLLAGKGLDVIGVDPAVASLNVARRKPAGDRVRWVLGDAGAVGPISVDLATMTGNVAQVFLTDDEWRTNLAAIRGVLRASGRLAFEVRDPARRGWEEWTRARSHALVKTAAAGVVETWVELTGVVLPLVSFRHTYRFDDGSHLTSDTTLRFRERDEIVASLGQAGFLVDDIRDAPDRPGKEIVFVARRDD